MIRVRRTLTLLGALCAALPALAPAQTSEPLALRAVRYYRAENQGQTRVRVLIQIPYMFMTPAGNALSYQVAVNVADAQGLTLHTDAWRNHAPADARVSGAFGLDMIDFAVASGKYKVDVTVTDSTSGRTLTGTVPIEGFTAQPEASDMLLASSMRVAAADDTVPKLGEVRRGNVLFTPAAHLRLTPLRTKAYYYVEAYNTGAEVSGTLKVSVRDLTGKTLLEVPVPTGIRQGGGELKGNLNLEGLPPGEYEMRLAVESPSVKFERSAPFTMAPLEETLARDTMRLAYERNTDEGWFSRMGPLALDSAYEPIGYVADPQELRAWDKTMSVEAKRRFLTQFWGRRDPTPGTPANEAREKFYAGIEFANKNYRERRVPGWKTDRGRIYIKNGPPDEVLSRVQEAKAPPYEAWRYTKGRQRWFIFADQSNGFGSYRLMVSNDLNEVCRPDWREILTEEAVRDAGRFLGIDFYSGQQANRQCS